jgi:hypothetical protein
MALKNRKFPHLLQEDIELWELFLEKHKDNYLRFDYDIKVGDGRDPGEDFPANIRKMAHDLSMRRIDVIGYKADAITIIEITKSAGLKAVGQMESYPILYKRKFAPVQRVDTLIVAGKIEADIEPILIEKGIDFIVLP